MKVKIELSGGLDLCFKTKDFIIELKDQTEIKILDLIKLMKEGYLKEKPEFFYQNDNIRPGILVLINDTDWELEGKNEAIIKDNDTVGFISTLHGG